MSLLARLRSRSGSKYRTVGVPEAVALIEGGAVLLDVRERAEFHAGHAPRARHVPLGQLSSRLDSLPAGRPVVTVCRSGARSARAARMLASSGFEVANLAGGMNAWARAGKTVVGSGGRRGRVA